MKKLFFITLTLISLQQASLAQNIIKGKILDAVSRQPLENVSIINADNPHQAYLATSTGGLFYKAGFQRRT